MVVVDVVVRVAVVSVVGLVVERVEVRGERGGAVRSPGMSSDGGSMVVVVVVVMVVVVAVVMFMVVVMVVAVVVMVVAMFVVE